MAGNSARLLLALTPMTEPEYQAFLEAIVPAYVAERVTADHVSHAIAAEFVHQQHARLLPQGRETAGHFFHSLKARDGGEHVGGVWHFVDEPNQQAFVYNITVWPAFRRRGFGSAALAHVEESVRAAGCATLAFNVFAANRGALAFYDRLGFAVVSSHMNKRL